MSPVSKQLYAFALFLLIALQVHSSLCIEDGQNCEQRCGQFHSQTITGDDFPGFSDPIAELGRLRSVAFGPFVIAPMASEKPDTVALIGRYNPNTCAVEEYSEQPSLFLPVNDLCLYYDMDEAGHGLCVGGSDIKWIDYDFGSGRFNMIVGPTIPDGNLLACYVHRDRAYVYDDNKSRFLVFDRQATANGGSFWTVSPWTISSMWPIMATNPRLEEIAVLNYSPGDRRVLIYRSAGPSQSIDLIGTISLTHDVTAMAFTRDDDLWTANSYSDNILVYKREMGRYTTPVPLFTRWGLAPVEYMEATKRGDGVSEVVVAFYPEGYALYRSEAPGEPYFEPKEDCNARLIPSTGLSVGGSAAPIATVTAMAYISQGLADSDGGVYALSMDRLSWNSTYSRAVDTDNNLCTLEFCTDASAADCIVTEDFSDARIPVDDCKSYRCDPTVGFYPVFEHVGRQCSSSILGRTCEGICGSSSCEVDMTACFASSSTA